MGKACQHIQSAINIAPICGNKIHHEEKLEDKLVIDFIKPLTQVLKGQIDKLCPDLRFWEWKAVPHNPLENGYTCDSCNVVMIFPAEN